MLMNLVARSDPLWMGKQNIRNEASCQRVKT